MTAPYRSPESSTPTESEAAVRLALLLVPILYGSVYISGKYVSTTMGPQIGAAIRFLASVLVMSAILRLRRGGWPPLPRELRWPVFLMGISGMVLFNLFLLWGMKLAPSSDGPVLSSAMGPLFTVPLAVRFLGEPLTRRRLTGLAVALVGTALFFAGIQAAGHGPLRLLGDLSYMASGLAWAVYSILSRQVSQKLNPLTLVVYTQIWGAALLVLLAVPDALRADWSSFSPAIWAHAVYLGLGATALAQWIYNLGIQRLGAGRTISYLYLVPVFGMLLAVVILNERPHLWQWIGGALLVTGSVLVSSRK